MASQILAGSCGIYKPLLPTQWKGAKKFTVLEDTCSEAYNIKVKFDDSNNDGTVIQMHRCAFTNLKTADFQGA